MLRSPSVLRFVLCGLLVSGIFATEARAQNVIDLCDLVQRNNLINVDIVSLRSNRRTGQVTIGLRLTNVSGENVPPPIYLTIEDITALSATVDNATGVDVHGIPFFVVGEELTEMPPGDSVDVSVVFGNVGRARFTFTTNAFGVEDQFFVTITDPLNLFLTSQFDIPVSGNIGPDAASVSVNGVPCNIVADTWITNLRVPLPNEGTNALSALAIKNDGTVANVAVTVTRDTTPPTVTFTSPLAGTTVFVDTINVTGAFNDPVSGLLSDEEPTVTVNGVPASVLNGAFLATDVALVLNNNTLSATVTDPAGNSTTVMQTIVLAVAEKKIVAFAGGNQTAAISQDLPSPLVVQCLEGISPAVNVTVFFRVKQSNGVFPDLSRLAAAQTDAQGFASIGFIVGSRTGQGCNRVEATANGFEGPAVFVSTSVGGAPEKINPSTGEMQVAAVDSQAPESLTAIVTDEGNNPLSGIKVFFEVLNGGGHFLENGGATLGATTDVTGRVQATFITGPLPGIDVNIVEAKIDPAENSSAPPVLYAVTGVVAGDPLDTTFSGVVLDHTDTPMQGVTMSIGMNSVQTDDNGQFLLTDVPVGPIHLEADGTTTVSPGTWPVLEFEHTTVAGIDNTLGMPVRLLPLAEDAPDAGGDEEVSLTLAEVPGFELRIFPHSVMFPDGSVVGQVTVTQVGYNKIPMPPGDGMQPNFIITVQPPNVAFDPPAQVTYPNVDGLGPGEMTNLYSFDHDLGRFVMIGPGTVSEDATVVVSDPGFGIVKGGWHCAGPSQPQGGAAPVSCKINGKANPDPVCLGLGEERTLNAEGDPDPPLDPAKPFTWTIPPSLQLVAGTVNSTSVTVKALVASPTGSIVCEYTCESGEFDTATVTAGGCDLFVQNSVRTLCQKNTFEILVDPACTVTSFTLQIRRTTDPGWLTLSTNKKETDFVQRIAGTFKLRGCAVVDGVTCYSDEKDLEVRFPTYAEIVADADVVSTSDASWASIKAYAFDNSTTDPIVRREEGYWYRLNTTTTPCAYEKTDTIPGLDFEPTEGASVNIGPRPPDSPATPAANAAGATYSVCSFHTHTPTAFRPVGRPVGPSDADQNVDTNLDEVPGIVYDYIGTTGAGSVNIPDSHPLNSAAKRFMSGLTRRPTP